MPWCWYTYIVLVNKTHNIVGIINEDEGDVPPIKDLLNLLISFCLHKLALMLQTGNDSKE